MDIKYINMENESKTWADVARELVLNQKLMEKYIELFGSDMEEYMPGFKDRFESLNDEEKVLFIVGLMKEMDSKCVSPSPESHQL